MNYSFSTSIFVQQFLPPFKRLARYISWLTVLLVPIQYLRDLFFDVYAGTNVTYPQWTSGAWTKGDRCRYSDNAIYECIQSVASPSPPPDLFSQYWVKIQDNFVGISYRIQYTAQILLFEYALNEWFNTDSDPCAFRQPPLTSDVYIEQVDITNNDFFIGFTELESSSIVATNAEGIDFIGAENPTSTFKSYIVWIPLATYDNLQPSEPSGVTANKDSIARNFIDRYNLAGIFYEVIPY